MEDGLEEHLSMEEMEADPNLIAIAGRNKTIITLVDGDVPGQVGMRVDHDPPLTDEDRKKPAAIHQVVALCFTRLWDMGVIQALTGPVCHDKIGPAPTTQQEPNPE